MINWRLVSLSEFTPITSNMELTHLGLKASIYNFSLINIFMNQSHYTEYFAYWDQP